MDNECSSSWARGPYMGLRPAPIEYSPYTANLQSNGLHIYQRGKIFLKKNWERMKNNFRGRPIFSENLGGVLDKQHFGSLYDSRMGKPILTKFRNGGSSVCTHSFRFSPERTEVSTNIAKSPYLLPFPTALSSDMLEGSRKNFLNEKQLRTPIHHIDIQV